MMVEAAAVATKGLVMVDTSEAIIGAATTMAALVRAVTTAAAAAEEEEPPPTCTKPRGPPSPRATT